MILFQIHHMWYETNMINECWDSILAAKKAAPNVQVKLKICFNKQTYIEKPEGKLNAEEFFEKHLDHPLFKDPTTEIVSKTNLFIFIFE